MIHRTAFVSLVAIALLCGCAKKPEQPQPPVATTDNEEDVGTTMPPGPSAPAEPPMDRGVKAAGLMQLLDTSPQCQKFRDQLEQAGKVPAGSPGAVDMSKIVAQANEAGCARKK
jgi:hypothetical protein